MTRRKTREPQESPEVAEPKPESEPHKAASRKASGTARVSVALLRPHTHAGIAYLSGSVITVTARDAQFLFQRGIAATNNLKE